MGELMRAHDWSSTPLGPPHGWPQALRTAIRLLLNSGHPMYVWWGPELFGFYNDAYSLSIGPERHPGSLGRPAREVWDEIWHIIGPQIDQVMSGGGATWHENALVPITRGGRREDVYWTYSYGPIDDDAAPSGVGGVLVICTETTSAVMAERRRAEEVVRQQRLFEQAPGFIMITRGPDHLVEFVNHAHRTVFNSGDWLGKAIREAFPSIIDPDFFTRLDEVMRTGETYRAHGAEVTFQRSPGAPSETRYLDFIYAPRVEENGQISGIFCEGLDATESRNARNVLVESEARFREVADAAPVLIWLSEADRGFTWFNKGWLVFTGLTLGEGAGHRWADVIHPDDLERAAQVYADAFERREPFRMDYRLRRADGAWRVIDANGAPRFAGDGTFVGFIGSCIDVTDQLEAAQALAEKALERSEAQFRLLVKGVRDYAIYMLDTTGRVTNWNLGAERIKGYRPDEIVGEHFSRFYTDEDRLGGVPERGLEIARREGRFETEGWRVRKDGARFWAHVVIDAIPDDEGRVMGFAKITRDVSERQAAQQALEEARVALFQSQKMEAIGQLTGGIAHDFNNLLMAVLGSLEMAQKRLPDDPQIHRLIGNAIQGAQRGATLTQRMLAFARRQELKHEAVDLSAMVREMGDLFERSLGSAYSFETAFPSDLPPVNSDPAQLEAALLNLVVNARDAMPEGGAITVSGRHAILQEGDALALPPGAYICLSVTDTGEGMDEATVARATEPFFTTKGIGKGTGLGLSMVHGLVSQSGGTMQIASRPGEGSRIDLWLPVARTAVAARLEPAPALSDADRQILTVLAVDDDELVLLNTAAMLEDLGHVVLKADNARAALSVLRSGVHVDVLVTDQAMPKMTGAQLAKAVRTEWPEMPIILATGFAELPPGVEAALPRLAKPFGQKEIDVAIRELTAARKVLV